MTEPPSLALRLHRAIRFMHQRNRTVSSAYGTGLGIAESAVLQELLAEPQLRASDLSTRLVLGPVSISRQLRRLQGQGLLRVHTAQHDRRARRLSVTAVGKRVFFQAYERACTTFSTAFSRLDSQEQVRFSDLFRRFLDGYGAPLASALPGDPPLMPEIRRLTRVLGMLGGSVFGSSGLSPLEWHIVVRVCTASTEVLISDLSSLYSVAANTVSQTVSRLEKAGFLERGASTRDRRCVPLQATAAGIQQHENIELLAASQIEKAWSGFAVSERSDFTTLWEKYAGSGTCEDEIVLGETRSLRRISSDFDRENARRFVYEGRVRALSTCGALPEIVCGKDSIILGLYAGANLQILIEFSRCGRNWSLIHAIYPEHAEFSMDFLPQALEQFFHISQAPALAIRKEYLPEPIWQHFSQGAVEEEIQIAAPGAAVRARTGSG